MDNCPKILIVDDKSENLFALSEALKCDDYQIVTVKSGDEALKKVLLEDFAVILLDVQMPGINGFETARLIRTRKKSKHTPIIFITANQEPEKVFEGYSLGAIDYIFKPIDTEALRYKVTGFVELFNHQEKLEERVKEKTSELRNTNKKLIQEFQVRKQSEEALATSETRFKAIFEGAGIGMALTEVTEETFCMVECNPTLQKMLGYNAKELKSISISNLTHPDDLKKTLEMHKKILAGKKSIRLEKYLLTKDKQPLWINVTWSLIEDNDTSKFGLMVLEDITDRKKFEMQLTHLATHDYLTDIPNRYSFEENLKRVVARATRGVKSALLFMDIDNFKLINDTKGHAAGDDVLVKVVKILLNNIREGDFLARLGGDEFGVILENVDLDKAMLIAEKLRDTVDKSDIYLPSYGLTHNLSISIGVVTVDGELDSQKLLSLADTALYVAKDNGRNRVSVVNPNEYILEELSQVNEMVNTIKKSLKKNQFTLLYQPIFDIENKDVLHFEALIRIIDEKEGNLIPPSAFIPVAERFGLMPQIDQWVTQQVLTALKQYPNIKVFVNISGASLGDENLLDYIEKSIIDSNIEPSRLGFEITETTVVKDLSVAERWIKRLRQLGCQFSLDDFGNGFSSFSYLKMLSVDYLKIDGTFVKNLDTDSSNIALVKAMKAVANSLGKKTIAEYIVNEDVLKILQDLNVEGGQGFYLGRPEDIFDKL